MAFRLTKPNDVRRFLARIANETYNGKLEAQTANSITTTCNAILNSMRLDDTQRALEALQDQVEAITGQVRFKAGEK